MISTSFTETLSEYGAAVAREEAEPVCAIPIERTIRSEERRAAARGERSGFNVAVRSKCVIPSRIDEYASDPSGGSLRFDSLRSLSPGGWSPNRTLRLRMGHKMLSGAG